MTTNWFTVKEKLYRLTGRVTKLNNLHHTDHAFLLHQITELESKIKILESRYSVLDSHRLVLETDYQFYKDRTTAITKVLQKLNLLPSK